ncbi:MAG: tetratricopeptide repeat protein [Gemmataceae bacterium]|nr:tetratricopeptide repeat protein [Gemmataceae bacterium]
MTTESVSTPSHDWHKAVPLLVIAGLLAYSNSFTKAYILDDAPWIANNANLGDPAAYLRSMGMRPVGAATVLLNYWLGGKSVLGFHAFNLAIHLAAALTLFGLVRRTLLLDRWQGRFDTSAPWLALSIALLWLVHPLQTQSVTYIIQRLESLMGLFYLLTLYCVVRGAAPLVADHPLPAAHRHWLWYAAAVVCFTLGMMTKEVMASAPVVVLLYDRTFLAGSFREAFRRRWGLYVALMLPWGLLVPERVLVEGTSAGFSTAGVTPLQYLMTQSGVLLYYVRLTFWPYPQCLDYQDWPIVTSLADCWLSGSVVVLALLGTAWALWRKPWLGFLGAWFFLVLAPTSSFVPIADVAFEHRMYLPLAPIAILVVLTGWAGLRWLAERRGWPDLVRRNLGAFLVAAAACALGTLTFVRNEAYRSSAVMWDDVLSRRPDCPRAHINRALSYLSANADSDLDAALFHLRTGLKRVPHDIAAREAIGVALWRKGKEEEAIKQLEETEKVVSGVTVGRTLLGRMLLMRGRPDEAVAQFRLAAKASPNSGGTLFSLAFALHEQGNDKEAKATLKEALRLAPDLPASTRREALAFLHDTSGRLGNVTKDGLMLARQASFGVGDRDPEYLDAVAVGYAANGKFDRATATAKRAVELARAGGQPNLAAAIARKLAYYERGQDPRPAAAAAGKGKTGGTTG